MFIIHIITEGEVINMKMLAKRAGTQSNNILSVNGWPSLKSERFPQNFHSNNSNAFFFAPILSFIIAKQSGREAMKQFYDRFFVNKLSYYTIYCANSIPVLQNKKI
jgi:hypothetical protein